MESCRHGGPPGLTTGLVQLQALCRRPGGAQLRYRLARLPPRCLRGCPGSNPWPVAAAAPSSRARFTIGLGTLPPHGGGQAVVHESTRRRWSPSERWGGAWPTNPRMRGGPQKGESGRWSTREKEGGGPQGREKAVAYRRESAGDGPQDREVRRGVCTGGRRGGMPTGER